MEDLMAKFKQRQHIRFNQIPEPLKGCNLITGLSYPIRKEENGLIYFGKAGEYQFNSTQFYTYYEIKNIIDRGGGGT
jgi:hypothetical protein